MYISEHALQYYCINRVRYYLITEITDVFNAVILLFLLRPGWLNELGSWIT